MKFYRFERLDKERCEAIVNKQLWLSRPDRFKDNKDCRFAGLSMPSISPSDFENLKKIVEIYYHREFDYEGSLLSESTINSLKDFINNSYATERNLDLSFEERLSISLSQSALVNKIRSDISNSVGICCFFSGNFDDPDMWRDYGDEHKGFCVEYEYTPEENCNVRNVTYLARPIHDVDLRNEGLVITARELFLCPEETFTRIVTTKSIGFKCESEYRFIGLFPFSGDEAGKLVSRPDNIKPLRVITGKNFDKNDIQYKGALEKTDLEVIPIEMAIIVAQGDLI